jgi:arylsulfatase A-like enzyme
MLRYWANCSWVDSMFGQVLDKLRGKGILDNALVIYTSDHGEMIGDRDFRFSKYCLYEGSVRVPLVVSGSVLPEELRGSVDQRPAELTDVLPTILEIAGIPVPTQLAGSSLLAAPSRMGTFSEHHFGYHGWGPSYMWRTNSAKLILYPAPPKQGREADWQDCRGELYDLESDPSELVNLYDDPERIQLRDEMTRNLLMHVLQVHNKYPCPDGTAR